MSRLILFNKPYGVLPQFTDRGTEGSAGPRFRTYIQVPGVYPAGRLDLDSEGLMLLTDDGRLQARIADPKYKLAKTYLVQVEGDVAEASLDALRRGVGLKDGMTRPAEARAHSRSRPVAARSAGALPQERARLLDQADHPRRAQPPGAADDGGGRPSDLAAGALGDRGLDARRAWPGEWRGRRSVLTLYPHPDHPDP